MEFVTLDADELEKINNLFNQLTYNEMRGVVRNSLRASARVLQKQTQKNIDSAPFRQNEDMENGVKSKVRLLGVDSSFATVYLWSWCRILETGTVLRQTKKGYNRGSIQGYLFFDKAKRQTENEVFKAMQTRLLEKIERTWNKRKK